MNTIEFDGATIRLDAITAIKLWERTEMDGTHPWSDVVVYISGSNFTERFWNKDAQFKEKAAERLDKVRQTWLFHQ